MTRSFRLLAACALTVAAAGAFAQTLPPPQNVLQLQASGTVEVQQDLLMMTLTTSRDGADPAAVQAQLRTALDAAVSAETMLANERFVQNAKPEVVQAEREKLERYRRELDAISD